MRFWAKVRNGAVSNVVTIEDHNTMTETTEYQVAKPSFKQKKISHLFHYTTEFDILLNIIENGFSPSYCYENIDELEYYIPMVSFCNIPITDVQLYMRYGEYGIGIDLEWARKRSISPVVYIHDSTPFKGLHRRINEILLNNYLFKSLQSLTLEITDGEENDKKKEEENNFIKSLKSINDETVPAIQFFKNWKTMHEGVV